MWHCRRRRPSAAIEMKPERDVKRLSMAAQMKLRRAREAEQALKESEKTGSPFSQRRLVYVPPGWRWLPMQRSRNCLAENTFV